MTKKEEWSIIVIRGMIIIAVVFCLIMIARNEKNKSTEKKIKFFEVTQGTNLYTVVDWNNWVDSGAVICKDKHGNVLILHGAYGPIQIIKIESAVTNEIEVNFRK